MSPVPRGEQRREVRAVRTYSPFVGQPRGRPASPRRSLLGSIVSIYKSVTVGSSETELSLRHHAGVDASHQLHRKPPHGRYAAG